MKKIYNILGAKNFFVEKGGPRFYGKKSNRVQDWLSPKEFYHIFLIQDYGKWVFSQRTLFLIKGCFFRKGIEFVIKM